MTEYYPEFKENYNNSRSNTLNKSEEKTHIWLKLIVWVQGFSSAV